MTVRRGVLVAVSAGTMFLGGCGSSQQFEAVPAGIDRNAVPSVSVALTARRYEFIPDTIRVRHGSLLKLRITSTNGTHGFSLGAFGIDERLEEGSPKEVELFVPRAGVFPFKCSHLCGIGHFGMDGVLIVE